MKRDLFLLAGGSTATLAGLLLRSCNMASDSALSAWCGDAPASAITLAIVENQSASHCAGCLLATLGAAVAIAAVGSIILRQALSPLRLQDAA